MDKKLLQPILDAFVAHGITDIYLQKAILANMQKECGLIPKEENLNYCKTDNSRIKSIFGSRVSKLSDSELSTIKCNPKEFAELIYGSGNSIGKSMGNVNPGMKEVTSPTSRLTMSTSTIVINGGTCSTSCSSGSNKIQQKHCFCCFFGVSEVLKNW